MSNSRIFKDFRIEKYRYRELSNFCLQYQKKKEELSACYDVGGIGNMTLRERYIFGRPTERKAERAMKLREEIGMIEKAALEASGGEKAVADKILKSVTQKITYERLGEVPCGRSKFYETRRMFFCILDDMKSR